LFLIMDVFLFEKKTKWLKKADLFNEEKTKN
jgi:Ca-activated chloride channel family protein